MPEWQTYAWTTAPYERSLEMPTLDTPSGPMSQYANDLEHAWARADISVARRDEAIGIIPPAIPPDMPTEEVIHAVIREAGRRPASAYATDCRCDTCWRIREFAASYPSGRDDEGMDCFGFDAGGYNEDGYDRYGRDENGITEDGYDQDGFNADGYNHYGYDREGYNEDGYDREGYDVDGQDQFGNERDTESGLEYYSYTPRLRFRGDKPPFFGMEIEVTTDYPGRLVDTVNEHAPSNLIYCKEDSSVQGAELVTHPMTYEWAMAEFPWDLLPALRDTCEATIVSQENGIHIHVSRDGFDTPAHMFRWLKFWYRNPNDIQRLARRRSNSWAAFSPDHRKGHKEHVKIANKASRVSGTRPCDCDDPYCQRLVGGMVNPNRYDSGEDATLERYSAINTTNDDTLEVRVFASTLRPRRAQAALQLVAGSVEYARQLRTESVAKRHGWDWPAFIDWAGKDGRYPALITENRVRRP